MKQISVFEIIAEQEHATLYTATIILVGLKTIDSEVKANYYVKLQLMRQCNKRSCI